MVKNKGTKQREQRSLGECWQWKANGQCSKGDNCSFGHDTNKRAKSTQPNPSPRYSTQHNVKNCIENQKSWRQKPKLEMARLPCKDYLKGTCTNSFCEKWLSSSMFFKTMSGCSFGKSARMHIVSDEQPSKRSKKNDDKSAVAMLKKNDWHEKVREPVVNHTKGHD